MKAQLSLFAAVVVGALAILAVQTLTAPPIAAQQRAALENRLRSALPGVAFDNALTGDCTNAPTRIYRASQHGQPAALVLPVTVPDGYKGPIELLIGLTPEGAIVSVQVLSHQETPGLGAQIAHEHTNWLEQFTGKHLEPTGQWRLKTEGGEFDAITGASITPRAVLRAVSKALQSLENQHAAIFAAANDCVEEA